MATDDPDALPTELEARAKRYNEYSLRIPHWRHSGAVMLEPVRRSSMAK